jgi:uncharacterized protein
VNKRLWHLRVYQPVDDIAATTKLPVATVNHALVSGRAKLMAARVQRVWPGRDDKILTSWNALMIRGLAISGRILGRDDLLDAADSAVEFLRQQLVVDGRLHATWKDGRARFNAYLDDHAFLLDALLELLQSRWHSRHLTFATWLAEQLLTHYNAPDGGYWFTRHDHEALPSGNGIAALALQRLGWLLAEPRYLTAAENTLRAAWEPMSEHPHGHASLLNALAEHLEPPRAIILRGDGAELVQWQATLQAAFNPGQLVYAIPADAAGLPPALADKSSRGESPVAYVCRGMVCGEPVRELAMVVRLDCGS